MQCLECVSILLFVYTFIKSKFFCVEVKYSCFSFSELSKQTADYQQSMVIYLCIPLQFNALY